MKYVVKIEVIVEAENREKAREAALKTIDNCNHHPSPLVVSINEVFGKQPEAFGRQ